MKSLFEYDSYGGIEYCRKPSKVISKANTKAFQNITIDVGKRIENITYVKTVNGIRNYRRIYD